MDLLMDRMWVWNREKRKALGSAWFWGLGEVGSKVLGCKFRDGGTVGQRRGHRRVEQGPGLEVGIEFCAGGSPGALLGLCPRRSPAPPCGAHQEALPGRPGPLRARTPQTRGAGPAQSCQPCPGTAPSSGAASGPTTHPEAEPPAWRPRAEALPGRSAQRGGAAHPALQPHRAPCLGRVQPPGPARFSGSLPGLRVRLTESPRRGPPPPQRPPPLPAPGTPPRAAPASTRPGPGAPGQPPGCVRAPLGSHPRGPLPPTPGWQGGAHAQRGPRTPPLLSTAQGAPAAAWL
ncbi:basic proline-rich protein-like [Rhinopithecus roxellana]|uniref:basic proline-rich protein-like n=1 Tax=Rhinopithecus roxellana TaxID=61622 RepID=UPI0012372ED4|nr:basic proline-rich protein-like [Rhinopithecus roxellana]